MPYAVFLELGILNLGVQLFKNAIFIALFGFHNSFILFFNLYIQMFWNEKIFFG